MLLFLHLLDVNYSLYLFRACVDFVKIYFMCYIYCTCIMRNKQNSVSCFVNIPVVITGQWQVDACWNHVDFQKTNSWLWRFDIYILLKFIKLEKCVIYGSLIFQLVIISHLATLHELFSFCNHAFDWTGWQCEAVSTNTMVLTNVDFNHLLPRLHK